MLENEIIKTIVFFDLFDYPLTPLEVWQNLGMKADQAEVLRALGNMPDLEAKDGFYFLSGRSQIVMTRLDRYNYSHRKFKRAALVTRFFSLIPWVELVAIGNQIGAGNSRDDSDIDFFIVTAPRRVWMTRLMAAGAMKLLNLRPRPRRKKDTICLSFYVSDQALDLSCTRLDDQDVYFRYWLASLVPVFDRNDSYARLIAANDWLKAELPNWQPIQNVWPHFLDSYDSVCLRFFGRILGQAENLSAWLQKLLMPASLRQNMNKNTNCLVNDNMLKLFVNDRREEWRRRYRDKLYSRNV